MDTKIVAKIIETLDFGIEYRDEKVIVIDQNKVRTRISKLAEFSSLGCGALQGYARFFVRTIAEELGIFPASIHDLYMARGRNEVPCTFTVPAMNLRILSFDAAKAIFRSALAIDAEALIFEIARSEMGYTDQKPAEYATSVLAAAIAEGYKGPVFIQGDHFQVSAKKYMIDPEPEINALKNLITDALKYGFYNIDIDASTLVDLKKQTIPEQQTANTTLSAMFTSYIRLHQPAGITVSVGGEIGEVGGHNSTPEELHAYLDGYNFALTRYGSELVGLSKVSVQTGTSHGGVVLPDGSIAEVTVDFETLKDLSRIARSKYQMGGTVQHGASTLPESAFNKFVENEAIEVHLATNFANIFYDKMPAGLKEEMYAYLDEKFAGDKKPGMTDEQFYYKTRKNVVGPFKKQSWSLSDEEKQPIIVAWEKLFTNLFQSLGLGGTKQYIDKYILPQQAEYTIEDYTGEVREDSDTKDLAD